jgi:SNF2 family DNA or RNA helicase
MKTEQFSWVEGRYRHRKPIQVATEAGRIFFKFDFCKPFMAEIKAMEGSKWHGPVGQRPAVDPQITLRLFGTTKVWSVEDNLRNRFQLDYLFGRNPYAWYDKPLVDFKSTRPLYAHQCDLAAFGLTRHYCIFAAEMGTGKTLAAIEIMEQSGVLDWWYIAPRSALKAVERELKIWKCKINPKMETYDALRTDIGKWLDGKAPPQGLILDESSRIKNHTAKRSQAAKALADGIRFHYGDKGFVILMSGSPAPKSPVDWWHQCEVACPGFLREGTVDKFQLRLGIFKQQESISGGVFQQRVTWLDDENKCKTCGLPKEDMAHDEKMSDNWHPFVKSTNEVQHLYKRMTGLVTVKFKRDCLDLPEKVYREIVCKPLPETLRAAKLIMAKAPNTISAMTLLRELSDGFQYIEVKDGKQKCEVCHGTRQYIEGNPEQQLSQTQDANAADFEIKTVVCPYCDENGEQDRMVRKIQEVKCPKDDALKDLLTEHDEVGRIVIYGGFSGSVDRCVDIALSQEWSVIRVDGRGWYQIDSKRQPMIGDPLSIFQDLKEDHPRVAFVGQPGAAGMGLTLTASPTICYFSNDFNAESRIQSEDRIHRPGMDVNRGATIIDLIHLPTDRTVLENLRAKRKLQDMTLGALEEALKFVGDERLF